MQIEIHHAAKKYLDRLPPQDRDRIKAAIRKLPGGDVRPYAGMPGYFRRKVGNYRILYEIDGDIIYVAHIEPRGQAYPLAGRAPSVAQLGTRPPAADTQNADQERVKL